MPYKIVYRNQDKKIIGVGSGNTGLIVNAGETLVTGLEGSIPSNIMPNCEWDTESDIAIDRGKWFHLYVTSESATIQANGSSTVAITVQKRKWDDSNLTAAGDNDNIQISSSRGLLNATSGALVNGTKTFILTSVAETVKSTVTASVTTGLLDSGEVEIEFVP